MNKKGDTIAAIATPLGEGGVGIVRISGEESLFILKRIFKREGQGEIESHRLYHGFIVEPSSGEILDEALAVFMRAPRSYTGEDVVEISCHSGVSLLKCILELVIREGATLSERGEFTKRAFLNGRIDLAQAEAVIDLVRAKTKEGAVVAAGQLSGKLSLAIGKIRSSLLDMLAKIEASIDFGEDVGDIDLQGEKGRLNDSLKAIKDLIKTADDGRILREGIRAAIVGRPNVGKSSLLNCLLREERAIVTDIPGTTRDMIEEVVSIKGIPLRIMDTAGLRHPKDYIEGKGIEKTKAALSSAELALVVLDTSEPLTEEDMAVLSSLDGKKALFILNKIDKGDKIKDLGRDPQVKISALYGEGIEKLEEEIFHLVTSKDIAASPTPILVNLRHKECLLRTEEALLRSLDSIEEGFPADFVAIDLKEAIVALGEVTGEAVSEEVINKIFGEFCVGK